MMQSMLTVWKNYQLRRRFCTFYWVHINHVVKIRKNGNAVLPCFLVSVPFFAVTNIQTQLTFLHGQDHFELYLFTTTKYTNQAHIFTP